MTFALVTDYESISDLAITAHAESGASNNSIEKFDVEIFIVKCWQQAGVGVYQSSSMLVEELLLNDDRINLNDKYYRTFKHWRHIYSPLHLYRAPVLPALEGARTDLDVGKTKKLFVRVKVPVGTPPAVYEGNLLLQSNSDTRGSLAIKIEILPIKLLQPPQEFFLWYKGRLDWRSPQHYVPESTYRLQVQDIFDHGFTSISISELDTQLAQRAIDIIEEIGYERFVVLVPPFPEISKLKFSKTVPVLYISDELDTHIEFPGNRNPESLIEHHRLNWRRARDQNTRTMASVTNHTFLNRFRNAEDIGHSPEIVSLYLKRNKEYMHFLQQLKDNSNTSIYYYWQCYMEKRNLNRVLAGVYLWKSGAAGISPYCYQHMPKYPNSPFNDFDEWEPEFHEGGINRPFKDHMTTYPARNGVIPTLQWEGLREGITDFKYLFTLHHWLEKAIDSQLPEAEAHASGVRKRMDEFLSRVNLTTIDINSESEVEPYQAIKPHEYEEFRNQTIDDITGLMKTLARETAPEPETGQNEGKTEQPNL